MTLGFSVCPILMFIMTRLRERKRAATSNCRRSLSPHEYCKGFRFSGMLTPKIRPTPIRKGALGKIRGIFRWAQKAGEYLGGVRWSLSVGRRGQLPQSFSLPWAGCRQSPRVLEKQRRHFLRLPRIRGLQASLGSQCSQGPTQRLTRATPSKVGLPPRGRPEPWPPCLPPCSPVAPPLQTRASQADCAPDTSLSTRNRPSWWQAVCVHLWL